VATTKTNLTERELDTLVWMYKVAGVTQQSLTRGYEISRSRVARIIAQYKGVPKS
jgi:DNA-binding transcriptional regulator LsrR (DeoR family)